MATQNAWTNEDGLEVNFGPVIGGSTAINHNHTKGNTKEIQIAIAASTLRGVGDEFSMKDELIPEGAFIQSARYIAEVDFDQAVSFGLTDKEGVEIDQSGLIGTGTTTAVGAGAWIGITATEVSYVAATATTTAPTVGSGTLIVEYIM